jgi:hypothetical protein
MIVSSGLTVPLVETVRATVPRVTGAVTYWTGASPYSAQ